MTTITDDTDPRSHIAGLLHRYPDVRPGEREEILTFLTRGTIIDRGMVRGDAALAPIVARVEADHPDRFKPRARGSLLVAILLIAPLLLVWWIAVSRTAT